ncbi:MAG: hypothetical protein EBT39_05125 [Sphingobacteriia bacterium]|nr:hypothetical protein [Candidatus Fonsibacter lacus]
MPNTQLLPKLLKTNLTNLKIVLRTGPGVTVPLVKLVALVTLVKLVVPIVKVTLLLLILLFLPSCAQDWSYQGNTAPQYWSSLKEEYKFCKIGYNQSPINIDFNAKNEQYIVKNDDLKFSYSSSGVTKEQDSHGTKFSFDRKDFMTLRKREYYLQAIQ